MRQLSKSFFKLKLSFLHISLHVTSTGSYALRPLILAGFEVTPEVT
jgi:hypothetical protein